MYYKWRWLIALLVFNGIFLAGGLIVIGPKKRQLIYLLSEENRLRQTVQKQQAQLTTQLPLDKAFKSPLLRLNDLMQLVQQNRLKILATQFDQNAFYQSDALKGMQLHLELKGAFDPLFSFLAALENNAYVTFILNFSSVIDHNELIFALDIFQPYSLSYFKSHHRTQPQSFSSPFCNHENTLASPRLRSNDFNVHTAKMIGYLQSSENTQALLLLPDNEVLTVKAGERIGKEQGVVNQIYPKHIVISLANHYRYSLFMNE